MNGDARVIYSARDLPQAYLLKNLLQESGIAAEITNAALQGALGELPVGTIAPQILVSAEDAGDALHLVAEFDERQRTRRQDEAEDLGESEADEWDTAYEEAAFRPACPECGKPRITRCPICETSGIDFPPGDRTRGGDDLLICRICDEPFRPEFFRRCTWCDHVFADGIDLPPPPADRPRPLNLRLIAAIAGMLLIGLALTGYFFIIARS